MAAHRDYGVGEAALAAVSDKAAAASSMKGNPIALTDAERERVLRLAF
jgi:alcohol dehydrogenase class IV